MVLKHPWSGLLQGAEEYIRWRAQDRVTRPELRQQLQAVLEEWDSRSVR
ncbi:hypothetical protein [Flindersiella endophytica]